MSVEGRLSDDAIDELARSIPVPGADAARTERVRTELLAAAGNVTQLPPRSVGARWITVAVGAGAVALAAAIALWVLVPRPDPQAPLLSHAILEPAAEADLVRIGQPPDEIIQLRDGVVTIEVAPIPAGHRFRVLTADAEVEVRGTRFVVAADHGDLRRVEVVRGVVELRLRSGASMTLAAGEAWPAPAPEPVAPAPEPVAPAPEPVAPSPQPKRSASPPAVASRPLAPTERAEHVAPAPAPAPAPEKPLAPGEADFKEGWEALRRGDAASAADAFARSAAAARGGAITEDARFWEGVARARAGDTARATRALRGFLDAFPRSSRAGEASARLGWLLLDAGHDAEARRRFEAAVDDAVPAVRRSARSGLARLDAR